MAVLVLDKAKKPLMPCSEKRARLLLARGRAVVHRRYPFTIRLRDVLAVQTVFQPVRLKLDPGSKTTGLALVRANAQDSILHRADGYGYFHTPKRAITGDCGTRAA